MNMMSYLSNKGLTELPKGTTVYFYGDKKPWLFDHMSDNGMTVWLRRRGEATATRGTTTAAVYVQYYDYEPRWTGTRFTRR